MEILPEAYPLRALEAPRLSAILPIAKDSFCSIGGRALLCREIPLRFARVSRGANWLELRCSARHELVRARIDINRGEVVKAEYELSP
jgi:hypothetical protein